MRGIKIDLTGQIFTWLTVKGRALRGKSYDVKWECVCKCGAERIVYGMMLTNGKTKSCGCWSRAQSSIINRTHGMSRKSKDHAKGYNSWISAKTRCFSPSNHKFPIYGARGITMCNRWRESFKEFIEDLGVCPAGMSIDRIDNDGNYSCGKCPQCTENGWVANCRWATPLQQANNRRQRRPKISV
jgi:hypothetical protein